MDDFFFFIAGTNYYIKLGGLDGGRDLFKSGYGR